MSSHVSNAFASEVSAPFRSAGRSWTTPPEIFFLLRATLINVSPECEKWRRGRFETKRRALKLARQTRTGSWLKADKSTQGSQVRLCPKADFSNARKCAGVALSVSLD